MARPDCDEEDSNMITSLLEQRGAAEFIVDVWPARIAFRRLDC